MTTILDELNAVDSKDGFVKFIGSLRQDFADNRDEWESQDLSSFLEAVAAWVEDMDGYYANTEGEDPLTHSRCWKMLADIFYAAKSYE